MKKNLKLILAGLSIVITIGLLCFINLYFEKREYDKKVNKLALVYIYQKDSIDKLKEIDFKICDSIYNFNLKEIKDTIFKNLALSNKSFPCSVNVIYTFNNGNKKEHLVEEFNCAGCSGINRYVLTKEGVEYQYRP